MDEKIKVLGDDVEVRYASVEAQRGRNDWEHGWIEIAPHLCISSQQWVFWHEIIEHGKTAFSLDNLEQPQIDGLALTIHTVVRDNWPFLMRLYEREIVK